MMAIFPTEPGGNLKSYFSILLQTTTTNHHLSLRTENWENFLFRQLLKGLPKRKCLVATVWAIVTISVCQRHCLWACWPPQGIDVKPLRPIPPTTFTFLKTKINFQVNYAHIYCLSIYKCKYKQVTNIRKLFKKCKLLFTFETPAYFHCFF